MGEIYIYQTSESTISSTLRIQIRNQIIMHRSSNKIEISIYLLMFIIRPTKGCDERAITAPLPAIEIKKKQHVNVKAMPTKLK